MFGKKKPQIKTTVSADFNIIPAEFYGTHDPVVHYNGSSKVERSQSKNERVSLSEILKNKKVLIIIGGVILLLAIGGIVWYYLVDAGIISKKEEIIIPKVEEKIVEEPVVEVSPVVTEVVSTTEEIVATITEEVVQLPSQEMEIDFPRVTLTNSVDLDNDGLTDLEEEIFGTDSGTSDTDKDGYYDGQEVNNLYNPRGIAPVKIIDSGLITEYTNPIWQYRIYYPAGWQVGEVDKEYKQVIFSAVTGDYIEVLVFQKNDGEKFGDWFARKGINQRITDLQTFQNRFQENGQRRQDNLVNYFERDNNVYVIIYHPASENGFVSFRHIVQMSVQSFRPKKTQISLPEQTVLPPSLTEKEIEDIFTDNANNTSTDNI